jgi:hypothetical protein
MISRIFNGQVLEAGGHYRFIFLVTITFLPGIFSTRGFWEGLFKFRLGFFMFSLKMVTFCKSAECPSSENLLAFQNGRISFAEGERIERHLSECEFCAAEIEFYTHYPQSNETVASVEIPIPLFELAKALLSSKHEDFSALNQLLREKEGVEI